MDNTNIIVKIRQIVRSVNLESKKIQKEYGVSIPQILCLSYLEGSDNYQATHKEITKYLNLNSSTASGIIYRLERKGFVARLPKGNDKRLSFIVLTMKGQELLSRVPPLMQDKISIKMEKLSTEKKEEIHNALDTLVRLLDIQDVDASPFLTIQDDLSKDS